MLRAAIMHKATREYCYPVEPGLFKIRLVTACNDVKRVILNIRDKYLSIDKLDTRSSYEMKLIASDDERDYYEAEIKIDMLCVRYYFEIFGNDDEAIYLGDDHFMNYEPTDVEDMYDCPQPIREEGMPCVPQWAKGKVVYQIFPTRFATTQYVSEDDWYNDKIGYNDKLHGNLRGIINKLDYLKELGVDIIYLTPIFKAETQHKYDTIDYYQVDPELGTNEDLKELVDQVHKRGMYILLDGVFNHTSSKFFAFEDLCQNGENSRYKDWYYVEEYPLFRGTREKLPNYKTFGYFGGMPKLNASNPETAEYIRNVVCHYLREFDIDGWRMDVADEIGHRFWKDLRIAAKKVKADALIVGEDWHICSDYLEGDEWDSCMNYSWYKALGRLYGGNGKIGEFISRVGQIRGRYHSNVFPILWNLMDSHDTPRFFTSMCDGKDVDKYLSAVALTALFPGNPYIYYGDEAGMQGGNDPENRKGMLWDDNRRNNEIFETYKKLDTFRHCHEELFGEIPEVVFLDEKKRLVAFKQSNLTMLFSLNDKKIFLDRALDKAVKSAHLALGRGIEKTSAGYALERYGFAVFNGLLSYII